MSTTYEEIYDLASRKLTDVELPLLPEEELEDMFHGYLISSISQFRKCKNDLSDRDEDEKQFNVDLLDVEKEILAVLIARQWLQPQINSALLTKQVFSDKESKFYSQKEAAQYMGISTGAMSEYVNGKSKPRNGYHWIRVGGYGYEK